MVYRTDVASASATPPAVGTPGVEGYPSDTTVVDPYMHYANTEEIRNIALADGIVPAKAVVQQMLQALQNGGIFWGADTGTAGAYVVAPARTPTGLQPAALKAGMRTQFLANAGPNGGACTLNYCGLGNKALVDKNGNAFTGNELAAGALVIAEYDGTEFRTENYATLSTPSEISFTSSGTLTVPAGKYAMFAAVWGGGGGSGGSSSSSAGGGGGGGGGYAEGWFAVTPGQVIAVTVGAAGSAGSAGGNGGAGGTSSVGSLLSATGGGGGVGVSSGIGSGGAGGVGSGGQMNVTGNAGNSSEIFGGTYTGGAGGQAFAGGQGGIWGAGNANKGGFPAAGSSGGANNNAGIAGQGGLVKVRF